MRVRPPGNPRTLPRMRAMGTPEEAVVHDVTAREAPTAAGSEPQTPLGYAHHQTVKMPPRMGSASGVIAFCACVFQGFWLIFCIYGALAGYFGTGVHTPFTGVCGGIYLGWPTLVAFGFGCHSIYAKGGISRNVLGLLVVIISGTIIALGIIQSCLH